MKRVLRIRIKSTISVLLFLCFIFSGRADAAAPFAIKLVASKTVYQSYEPVKMQVNVVNINNGDVIANKGFWDRDFHLLITFTAPDGSIVRNRFEQGGHEPGPPINYNGMECYPVDIIPDLEGSYRLITNAIDFYDLYQPGIWTAEIRTSAVVYSRYFIDEDDGSTIGCVPDSGLQVFNPLASNRVSFEILSELPDQTSAMEVKINLHHDKDDKDEHKKNKKGKSLENIPIRLFSQSDLDLLIDENSYDVICDKGDLYSIIWTNIEPRRSALTNGDGLAYLEGVVPDDYLILAFVNYSKEYRYLGDFVKATNVDWQTVEPVKVELDAKDEKYWEKHWDRTAKYKERRWRQQWQRTCNENKDDRNEWKKKWKKWKKLKDEHKRDDHDDD